MATPQKRGTRSATPQTYCGGSEPTIGHHRLSYDDTKTRTKSKTKSMRPITIGDLPPRHARPKPTLRLPISDETTGGCSGTLTWRLSWRSPSRGWRVALLLAHNRTHPSSAEDASTPFRENATLRTYPVWPSSERRHAAASVSQSLTVWSSEPDARWLRCTTTHEKERGTA